MSAFGLNLYVLSSFLSKLFTRSMEEGEEDLFFSFFTHMHEFFEDVVDNRFYFMHDLWF